MTPFAIATLVCMLSLPLSAQWLDRPTPGIPRTAGGKPNLTAPAPHTADGKPDLSGLWQRLATSYERNIASDLKPGEVQPWAEALVERRTEELGRDHMALQCLPWGPNYTNSPRMTKVVQTPGLILMLDESLTYRQIFTDGRKLETDPNPSWMGYSVAHWDGDTLVVESNGYNDRTWLDRDGHPHTEALRTTERYRRPDFGHLEIQYTLNDPKVYARPWTIALHAQLAVDTEMLESVCNETTAGREHWVGKASDEKNSAITVAPEILAKYTGTYEELDNWGQGPHPRTIQITLSDGALFAEMKGRGKVPLLAQSETKFSGLYGLGAEFVREGQGVPIYLLEMRVSGNYRFRRKP